MKIAIVNDVILIAEALRRVIANTHEHEVIWAAHSGEQAVRFCAENRPDLILMDLIMPGMDGVEATRRIMQQSPCAILIVTASPEENTSMVFRALGAGALDVTATPMLSGRTASDLALMAKIKTVGKLIAADLPANAATARLSPSPSPSPALQNIETLIAIGASTGGPLALAKILGTWKPPANAVAVIVQHIDQAFTNSFSNWLSSQIDFPIDVIEDGGHLLPGRIMVAKTNDHVVLGQNERLHYMGEAGQLSVSPLHRRVLPLRRAALEEKCRGRPPYRHGTRRCSGTAGNEKGGKTDDCAGPADQCRVRHAACGSGHRRGGIDLAAGKNRRDAQHQGRKKCKQQQNRQALMQHLGN
jgi:two-component system, chemotaxis family, response regulator WspF